MRDDPVRRGMETALGRLVARAEAPRVLALSADDRARLEAASRARPRAVARTVRAGPDSRAGRRHGGGQEHAHQCPGRTRHRRGERDPARPPASLQVYHHRDDNLGTLTPSWPARCRSSRTTGPSCGSRCSSIPPTWTASSSAPRHDQGVARSAAGLVLYIFSPERYLEERTWSVLRQETVFMRLAAILNKVDRVGSREELEQITEDLRERFAALGLGNIRIFRVCAPGSTSRTPMGRCPSWRRWSTTRWPCGPSSSASYRPARSPGCGVCSARKW